MVLTDTTDGKTIVEGRKAIEEFEKLKDNFRKMKATEEELQAKMKIIYSKISTMQYELINKYGVDKFWGKIV